MNKNSINITAIVSKKQYDEIKKIAKNNHQSISGCMRVIIDNFLKTRQKIRLDKLLTKKVL